MKETKEFIQLPAGLVNAIYAALADGDFNLLKDFQAFIPLFLSGQPAIDGFDKIKDEQITATIEEREDVKRIIPLSLSNVPESDKYDLTEAFSGMLSIVRFAWRKGYEKAKNEELERTGKG